ncbi:jg12308 [Pararge aegeria aegeria]|uniref:Jg12308 protein n=1 Tax=Pararge aegeria aegeria TaxID=348720 RepID=A0A8S4RLG2_9NEOP|nr:jg12308 [Pararge aegeria aegeria]
MGEMEKVCKLATLHGRKSYSMMSLKTTLAHVLRRYRVSGNHSQMVAKIDVSLKPVSGHHVKIDSRVQ